MNPSKNDKIKLREKMEHRILHGLVCEWENAMWVLPSEFKNKMKKPMFSLGDMNSRLGYWDGSRREIRLSRAFTLSHSWNDVRDVLLHETAHQLAEEVLHAGNEQPHGKSFHKACRMLRADPGASGKYSPLSERVREGGECREDKIMLRIKKLMALSKSRNRYEAEVAMAKAYEYIRKYNIDLLSMREDRDFISVFAGKPALRHFRETYYMGSLLNDFYFVSVIWVSSYVIEKNVTFLF